MEIRVRRRVSLAVARDFPGELRKRGTGASVWPEGEEQAHKSFCHFERSEKSASVPNQLNKGRSLALLRMTS